MIIITKLLRKQIIYITDKMGKKEKNSYYNNQKGFLFMYEVKPKRKGFIFFVVLCFMMLSAIGAGIGYAGVKLFGKPSESEFVQEMNPASVVENTTTQKEANDDITNQGTEAVNSGHLPENKFMYLIKLENGKTKVYSLPGETPVYSHELPVKPGALPPDDLELLKEGIYLKNKEELLSFTEDFCS